MRDPWRWAFQEDFPTPRHVIDAGARGSWEVGEVEEVTEEGIRDSGLWIPDARFRAQSATHYCLRWRGGLAVGGQLGFDLPEQEGLFAAEQVGFREGQFLEPDPVAGHGLGDL